MASMIVIMTGIMVAVQNPSMARGGGGGGGGGGRGGGGGGGGRGREGVRDGQVRGEGERARAFSDRG